MQYNNEAFATSDLEGHDMGRRYSRRGVLGLIGGTALAGAAVGLAGGSNVRTVFALTATPSPMASPVAEPGDQVWFRVEYTGGFVPVEFIFTNLPTVSIYADGRVITTGPMIEVYPQPALPNLRQTVLTESGIQRVLEEIRTSGLFAKDAHYEGPEITDLPDTVFTLIEGGKTVVVSAYALGVDETMLPERVDAGARGKLLNLLAFVSDPANNLAADEIASADEAYEIERIKVLARELDPNNPPWDDPALAQQPVAWPLDTPLASIGQPHEGPYGDQAPLCAALDGDDAAALVTALEGANQLTPWESDGTQYLLWVRPLLPDEPTSC